MSFYALDEGSAGLGAFIAAMLAVVIGVQWVVAGFALIMVLLSLLLFVMLPRVRKLD